MAEYLSPGVYMEEFDLQEVTIEAVGTSTAGFVGMAEKGPVGGEPQLVTNFSEFKQTFGEYLSENEFGNYRFLSYAVEYFFINGGSRCYVTRVVPSDAVCAEGVVPNSENPVLKFTAKSPGTWGNGLGVAIFPSSKAKTQIFEVMETVERKRYSVKRNAGFFERDIVAFSDGNSTVYNRVVDSKDNIITFEDAFDVDVTDRKLLPEKFISTCEFSMEIRSGDIVERYENLSLDINSPRFVETQILKSLLIRAEYIEKENDEYRPPFQRLAPLGKKTASVAFLGGSNGSMRNLAASDFNGSGNEKGKRTGIQTFMDNDEISIIAIPGITNLEVQHSLINHCETKASRFAVLDIPKEAKTVQDIMGHRGNFDTTYAAFYHPWLTVFDPLGKKHISIPPSGAIMGIYARSDNNRGVHKAPANEVVRACVGLETEFSKDELDILNPIGINLIRALPGQGIRVWGARTAGSNGNWRYLNVRRLFIFIEESIKVNIRWVKFEENNEILWTRVKRTIEVFLENLWRDGALAGMSSDEAFFVKIGRDTMTQEDLDNGCLICDIGVAPVRPAEYIIFRITQNTGSAQ